MNIMLLLKSWNVNEFILLLFLGRQEIIKGNNNRKNNKVQK